MLIFDVIIYFILFSFCGWVCETVFCSVAERKFVYRGFLNGPICPIYGFGGLAVVYLLAPFKDNIVILFIFGMIVTTVIEYFTSFLLEKLFHEKWWDYSHRRFNLNGRVCFSFALMFGALSVLAVKLLYPPFSNFVENIIPFKAKPYIASGLLFILLSDLAVTVTSLLRENGKLAELELQMEAFKAKMEKKHEERIPLSVQWEDYKEAHEKKEKTSLREFLDSLDEKIGSRMDKSYPNKKPSKRRDYNEVLKKWFAENVIKKDAESEEQDEDLT